MSGLVMSDVKVAAGNFYLHGNIAMEGYLFAT
jgi:hypothetical protein